jgi:hypothetical protein
MPVARRLLKTIYMMTMTLFVSGATMVTSTCFAKWRAVMCGHHAFIRQKAGVADIIMIRL